MADWHKTTKRVPLHLLYFLLFFLAILCGLWQHGHPILTLGLLVVVGPVSLVGFIPRRWLHQEVLLIIQYIVAGCAMGWAVYRFGQQPPMDLLLIEVFAILGVSFAFSLARRGYFYILLISLVLMFYGSLSPAREIFLWCMPLGLLICLILLYGTRVASLANQTELETRGTVSRRNWVWLTLHGAMVLAFWGILTVVYPVPRGASTGLAPTSFRSENYKPPPPRLSRWFKSRHFRHDKDAAELMDGQSADVLSDQAMVRVPAGGGGDMDSIGAGSGQPGDDLVMLIKAPVKLYWLGRLYDIYDGVEWKRSKKMRNQHVRLNGRHRSSVSSARQITQQVTIEKWVSPVLFSSYLRIGHVSTLDGMTRIRNRFDSSELMDLDKLHKLPFTYEVTSAVDFHLNQGDSQGALDGWYEELPPEHYTRLPMQHMSERVRALAFQLTNPVDEPLAKAFALRDYLRANYSYSLSAPSPPEGVEPVDWFLFEQKSGHCEFYAASMTVLARLSGLPARVATGYAPGNYNVLTGMFEVYEYHAHAWTQVFVPGMGWLTMDATPPGSVPNQSRTTPAMIGNLRDPFTDEWQIRTPEISKDTQDYMLSKLEAEKQAERARQAQASATQGAAEKPTGFIAQLDKILSGEPSPPGTTHAPGSQSAFSEALVNMRALLASIIAFAKAAGRTVLELLMMWQVIVGLAALVVLRILAGRLHRLLRAHKLKRRCDRWFAEAARRRDSDPAGCISYCYRGVCGLLELSGRPRLPSKDLDDYLVDDVYPDMRGSARAVFDAYVKLLYKPMEPDHADALKAYTGASEIRERMQAHLQGTPHRGIDS